MNAKIKLFCLVSISFVLFYGCTLENKPLDEVKSLKVLSWNIWHGGHFAKYQEKACEGTRDILKKSEADVILMIETYMLPIMVLS